ncbi:MAG TPA: filamentous hemagglutinin family protein [Xanthobacteraceae bacterium]|jgi:hypothetical protein|nr:filamentous hemagglutinin family protein [Xanthobacteraceae bacterium]
MVVAVVLLLAATAADAGEAGSPAAAERPVVFDIPAQPLAVALEVYSATTGIEVFYDAALATGRRSADVKGSLPAMRGLQVLLRGTGYVPRATGPGSISIAPSSLQTEQQIPASTRNFDRYESYLAMLQARLGRTLCRGGNSIDPTAVPVADIKVTSSGTVNTALSIVGFGNPYLPKGGAAVNVLFGVGPGMNTAGFIGAYIDPITSGATGAAYADDLVSFVTRYESETRTPVSGSLTAAQAWTIFKTLPANQQQLLVEEVFFDILNATGLDYNIQSSPSYHQYSAGYQAINTLFPAAFGYTVNALGTVNGANKLVQTGNLDMRGSTIQTQQGGDISILGPGGGILVGSSVAAPAINPASEGIITLESGNIDIITDRDVQVAQSRIMTEQGGNILMWSSNGNLDAGKGAKTSVSAPPPKFDCDIDWICSVDIKGEVSGAGIATLQSLPGVPIGDANLIAPRGTVNAGAAGLRVSGNLNIAALQILNAYNIQVQGTITGLPTYSGPSMGALTTASNVAGAQQIALPAQSDANKDRPSIVIVEFVGFGGGDNDIQPQDDQQKNSGKRTDNQMQDPNSRYQIIGVGEITDDQAKQLAEQRRSETGR